MEAWQSGLLHLIGNQEYLKEYRKFKSCRFLQITRGISSAGRATVLQVVGHRFEPDILHQTFLMRAWYSGCAGDFQSSETSSILVARSKI